MQIQYERVTTLTPFSGFYEKTNYDFQRDLQTCVEFAFDQYKQIIRCTYKEFGQITKVAYFRKRHQFGLTKEDVERLIPYL